LDKVSLWTIPACKQRLSGIDRLTFLCSFVYCCTDRRTTAQQQFTTSTPINRQPSSESPR
jgi:hypothetical protein